MGILASNPPAVANYGADPFTYPQPYAISSIEVTVEGLFVGLWRIAFETIRALRSWSCSRETQSCAARAVLVRNFRKEAKKDLYYYK